MRTLDQFIATSPTLKDARANGQIELRLTPDGKGVEFNIKPGLDGAASIVNMLAMEMANPAVMAFKGY
jgi:hypothetical protein